MPVKRKQRDLPGSTNQGGDLPVDAAVGKYPQTDHRQRGRWSPEKMPRATRGLARN